MKKFLEKLLIVISFFISFQVTASHIVGGYLSYKCNGPISANEASYELTMYFYRDCDPGNAAGPVRIPISVFSGNTLVDQFDMTNRIGLRVVPDDINNPCVATSPDVCVEEYIFQTTIFLRRNQTHTLVYQRCCKNNSIDNLADPPPMIPPRQSDFYGNTFTAEVPAFNSIGCNSAPEFNEFPPILLCSGFDVNLDLSAIDADGDSLAYSLCAPLDFNLNQLPLLPNGATNPAPDTANTPPYTLLPFKAPQTAANPIPSSPNISINPTTGLLTGTATNLGDYTLGFCVEEWRNEVLINTLRREIQVTTQTCNPVVNSVVQDQMQFCEGLGVQFRNNTTTNLQRPPDQLDYIWDFGVPGTNTDISTDFEPFFTFPSPGFYTITMVINPDHPSCRDTSVEVFEVRPKINPTIIQGGKVCVNDNNIQFTTTGNYQSNTIYAWDFGNQPNINSSTNDTVNGVIYPGQGNYPVQLIVMQDNCADTVTDVVSLFENPTVNFTFDTAAGCYPLPVNFTSSVTPNNNNVVYDWDFGDGQTSTLANPSNTYLANGMYDVNLTIRTTSECIDTVSLTRNNIINVSLDLSRNDVGFIFDMDTGCAPVQIQFTDTSFFEGAAKFKWFFGDGDSSTLQNPTHLYTENGKYEVQLILTTTEKCVDTLTLTQPDLIDLSLAYSQNAVNFDFFPKEGCPPLTVQFSDSSVFDGAADFFWDFGDGELSTDQNPINTYTDTGSYSIGLLLIPKERCIDTLVKTISDAIRVLPTPVANINVSDSALTLKEAFFNFNNNGSEFVQSSRYLINGVEVAQEDFLDYRFLDTGHFNVSYIASNSFGCEDTSSAEVFVFDEFEFIIPNVFTPNQDGVNDNFAMRACGVYEYEIEIFNRFGTKVFESNSMNINWDGRISGRSANSGSYFYTIRIKDFRGEFLNYNGSVTLLRE